MKNLHCSRRRFIASFGLAAPLAFGGLMQSASASTDTGETLMKKFKYLSENGNGNCSTRFLKSIATMPSGARLQGSCCAPMDAHRYVEQVQALRKFSSIEEIPPDPYDVPVDLAKKLMSYYDLSLKDGELTAYDHAMSNSDEKGPCCCQCWRWHVYGGLGKLLIHEKGFDGPRLIEVWNLSSGCGGGTEHHH